MNKLSGAQIKMDIISYSTATIYDKISRCETLEEYKQILSAINSQKEEWIIKISNILEDNNITDFAKKCGVSRVAVQKWKKGSIPKYRDTYIKIGFAAGYTLEEMNEFLKRYGRCTGLYARNLEDLVYIYVLSSKGIEHTYERCRDIINILKQEMEVAFVEDLIVHDTSNVLQSITKINELEELVLFVKENAAIFSKQYNKFYSFVELYINLNRIGDTSNKNNISLMTNNCSSSLKHCVYDIVNRKWYPKRNKIISLGIHLNMNVEQINEMLLLVNMEPLYAKNPFENSIIFALENAMLEDKILEGTDDLKKYVKEVLVSLGFSNAQFLIDEAMNSESEIF